MNFTTSIDYAKCVGFLWNKTLSTKPAIEKKTLPELYRRQFFALVPTGCYLGYYYLSSVKDIVETFILQIPSFTNTT